MCERADCCRAPSQPALPPSYPGMPSPPARRRLPMPSQALRVLDCQRQRCRLVSQRPVRDFKCVHPRLRRPHRLEDLLDGLVVRIRLRRGRVGAGARAAPEAGQSGSASDRPISRSHPSNSFSPASEPRRLSPPGTMVPSRPKRLLTSHIETDIGARRPNGWGRRQLHPESPDSPQLLSACVPSPSLLRSFPLTTTGARCVGPPAEYNSRSRCGVAPRA